MNTEFVLAPVVLGSLPTSSYFAPAVAKRLPLLAEGWNCLVGRRQTKILAKFTKSLTKTSGVGERPEAMHRIVALFSTAMV